MDVLVTSSVLIPVAGSKYSKNCDLVTNSHGKTLKNICKSYKCYILNNLTLPDKQFDGKFTFRKGERKSQVDVCISNAKGLDFIDSSKVEEIGWNPSDHNPIVSDVTFPLYNSKLVSEASYEINSSATVRNREKLGKIKSKLVNWDNYVGIIDCDIRRYHSKIIYGTIDSEDS